MHAMKLFLSNTLTRRKELFVPADPAKVTIYVCGPTVWDYAHIGNARPAVVFDVLFRMLRKAYGEAAVHYARNFTDVDDRIIAKAAKEGRPIEEITEHFAKIYLADVGALGVLRPTYEPRATGHMDGMIAMVDRLIGCGCAYRVKSGVYFCVETIAEYGKLSGRALEDMIAGARVEGEDDKRNPADFALWKSATEDQLHWPAPFGAGRPGWHIECSAMIKATLGETIDIHAGGLDLIFPHHENEIAQSEAANGAPLARYWLHNGFLTMSSEKMSKSLGNVALIHDLLEDWPGEVLRMALLTAHYKAPLDFTDALLQQCRANLDRFYGALRRLKDVPAASAEAPAAFREALEDDLNTPEALAALFALATAANKSEDRQEQARLKGEMLAAGALIGLLQEDPDVWARGDEAEAGEIDALVAARVAARAAKNWAEADRIRNDLAARGVEIMDAGSGSTWRRIS
jgi:cysteinyl-tRNA synthetase